MHPMDVKEQPTLYKMNFLTHEKLIENLTILIEADTLLTEEDVLFPSEEEIVDELIKNSPVQVNETESSTHISFNCMHPLAVVWDDVDRRYWCVALFLRYVDNGMVEADNLVEKKKSGNVEWIRPAVDDIQDIPMHFIIPCEVRGRWDYSSRVSRFIMTNVKIFAINFD